MRFVTLAVVALGAMAVVLSGCGLETAAGEATRAPSTVTWATPTPRPDGAQPTGGAATLPACDWARVISVHDGDTIRVSVDNGPYVRLRYIGIDAPEVAGQNGPAEPFADEAAQRNRELVEGKQICLERDVSDVDQYGRMLRYVWLEDGRMVEEILLGEGLARVVTFRPDTKYHKSRLTPIEARAREAELGIWGE